jgi:hypothetical protein
MNQGVNGPWRARFLLKSNGLLPRCCAPRALDTSLRLPPSSAGRRWPGARATAAPAPFAPFADSDGKKKSDLINDTMK